MHSKNFDIEITVEPIIYDFISRYETKYINLDKLFEYGYKLIASSRKSNNWKK